MRKLALVAIFIALACITAAMVGASVFGVRCLIDWRWHDDELARIKASGEPLTLSDLAGPKIPASQNAATIYMRAVELLQKAHYTPELPVLQDFLDPEKRAKHPELWAKARNLVRKHRSELYLAAEATAKSKCRYPMDWNQGIEVRFSWLRPLCFLSDLFGAQALLQARDGISSDAVRSLRLELLCAESVRNEPALIPQLAMMRCLRTSCKVLRRTPRCADFSDEQAYEILNTLRRVDLQRSFHHGLLGERVIFLSVFSELRKYGVDAYRKPGSRPKGSLHSPEAVALVRPWFFLNETAYLRRMHTILDMAAAPAWTWRHTMRSDKNLEHFPRYTFLSARVIRVLAQSFEVRDQVMAETGGTEVLLALAVYRHRYGRYPPTLTPVEQRLGLRLPLDPFSGKPFAYQRLKHGFVLSSAGSRPGARSSKWADTPAHRKALIWKWTE